MSHLYKEPKFCECGYNTRNRGGFSIHRSRCSLVRERDQSSTDEHWKRQVESLEQDKRSLHEQLVAKDEQLVAKDKQIEELIKVAKKPRTVVQNTTNNWTVDASVNCYGKEKLDHISEKDIRRILANPPTAVAEFIRLKHKKEPSNANVRCPNLKRAMYQVVADGEDEDGEPVKQWEYRPKGDVLEDLYETNAGHLEAEADEEDYYGNRFLDHQDKVKSSSEGEDGGRRYKDQLDRIHCVITSM